jgi:hypothetical protein
MRMKSLMLGGGVLAFFAAAGGHAMSSHDAHLAHLAHRGNQGGTTLAVSSGALMSGPIVGLGQSMAAGYGWTAGNGQFACLDRLWTRESGWRMVWNFQGSGAYGIPQALPASKMASAGADYMTNPVTQIRWGLGYIKSVYGTPCGAWAHETGQGWY